MDCQRYRNLNENPIYFEFFWFEFSEERPKKKSEHSQSATWVLHEANYEYIKKKERWKRCPVRVSKPLLCKLQERAPNKKATLPIP